MQKLVESGLFGNGLVHVDSPTLVKRYNDCLKAIGIEPTNLKEFKIDGIGWSPEVSKEKDRIKYFSCNDLQTASQFGIILTPDQSGLPVYTPFNSFDRAVMAKLFRNSGKQIAELTQRSALWLDFTQDLLEFSSPSDLFMIEEVVVRVSDTKGLIQAAQNQRDLVKRFREGNNVWLDGSERAKIIESAKLHGDLRFKPLIIQDIHFNDVRSFYTRAFGGTYIFRDFSSDRPLMIIESEKCEKTVADVEFAKSISDPGLSEILLKEDITDLSLGWHKRHLVELEELQDLIIADCFYQQPENAEADFASLTSACKKQWIARSNGSIPPLLGEISRLIATLRKDEPIKKISVSLKNNSGIYPVIMRPSKEAEKSEQTTKVVWQLLARLAPHDIERLYLFNRILFYDLYRSWSEGKKKWAIAYLKKRGHPRANNNGDGH